MLKKELAALLDISPAMVSRLAKQGMPVDTLERAKRWRKRHLEPGRIKGSRFDPNASMAPAHPSPLATRFDPLAALAKQMGDVDAALVTAPNQNPLDLLAPLRYTLRHLPEDAAPAMPLRVWVALVNWVLGANSRARHAQDQAAMLTPMEFSIMAAPHCVPMAAAWLDHACNWADRPDDYYSEDCPDACPET